MSGMELTSDPAEIVQAEDHGMDNTPVAVTVSGPVQTRELPASGYPGYKTETGVTSGLGVRILAMEPRRKSATILALAGDIWIGVSQGAVQAGSGGAMRWPMNVPKTISHIHEVWVCAATTTTDVSVETINWSE